MYDLAVICLVFIALGGVVKWGHGPERTGGQIMLLIISLGIVRALLTDGDVDDFDAFGLISDIVAFAGMVWIALFAWRYWPLWSAALQLLAIGAHFGPALALPIEPIVYALMRSAPTIIVLVTLVGATWLNRGLESAPGNNVHWRNWSVPLNRISPKKLQSVSWRSLERSERS